MHDDRLANLFGAAGLAATDLVLAGLASAAGISASAAAALVVLNGSGGPGITTTELGRRVGLTQSAATRMVDSLVSAALARREPGPGRAVTVRITTAGRRTVRKLLAARTAALSDALDELGSRERAMLTALLGKVLPRLYQQIGSADTLCRLCDRAVCTADAECPVGKAERESADSAG